MHVNRDITMSSFDQKKISVPKLNKKTSRHNTKTKQLYFSAILLQATQFLESIVANDEA